MKNEKFMCFKDFALSCIEEYTLSILNKYGFEISYLFCCSYVSSHELLYEIINNNVRMKNFNLVPRIHEIAYENLLMINLVSYDLDSLESTLIQMKLSKKNTYYLIKIMSSSNFFNSKLKPIRNDHYVCCWFEKKSNIVFNCYPFCIKRITDCDLENAYNGNIIELQIQRKKSEFIYKNKSLDLLYKHMNKIKYFEYAFDISKITVNEIIEFLTVYKRILGRMSYFFNHVLREISIIGDTLALVDNLLTIIYINLEKNRHISYSGYIKKILDCDRIIYNNILNVIGEINDQKSVTK